MATSERFPASIAFVAVPRLKQMSAAMSYRALSALHEVLREQRAGLLRPPARILSTLTGAVLVVPDAMQSYLEQHLGDIARRYLALGLAIRVGVTHGDVVELPDVDETANMIGTSINVAARLAMSPTNTGCAFHRDFIVYSQGMILGSDALTPGAYPKVEIPGKKHDAPFACTLAPAEAFPVLPGVAEARLPALLGGSIANVPAAILAYDLPHFSAGDPNQLGKRFRAVIAAMQSARVRTRAKSYFSPGGDGGLVVLELDSRFGKAEAHEVALRLFDQLAAESEGLEEELRVECRLGMHYGPVQLYKNAEEVLRPTGRNCFIADEISSDEQAKKHGGIVVSADFCDVISDGSNRRLAALFEKLPNITDTTSPAHDIERYVRRAGSPAQPSAPTPPEKPTARASADAEPPTGRGPLFVAIADSEAHGAVDNLKVHLSLAIRHDKLRFWTAREIEGGDEVNALSTTRIGQADAILLFVTPRLLTGQSYALVELAMKRGKKGARIIPIIVDHVLLDQTPFKGLAPLPQDAVNQDKVIRPIVGRRKPDQEQAWAEIAGALTQLAQKLGR